MNLSIIFSLSIFSIFSSYYSLVTTKNFIFLSKNMRNLYLAEKLGTVMVNKTAVILGLNLSEL